MCKMYPLKDVETYIENVRSKLPQKYNEHYSFLHTFLCINMYIKGCEWIEGHRCKKCDKGD